MTRTTLDLDPVVLSALKKRGKREGKSLGRLVSELLAEPLANDQQPKKLQWISKDMGALVDLEDHDAVWRAMEE